MELGKNDGIDFLGLPVVDGPRRTVSLLSKRSPLTSPGEQLRELNDLSINIGPTETGIFFNDIEDAGWSSLKPERLDIFQINLGKLCNMTCAHCHVDSGPDRTEENMNRETVDECLDAIRRSGAKVVDLTGGAPS